MTKKEKKRLSSIYYGTQWSYWPLKTGMHSPLKYVDGRWSMKWNVSETIVTNQKTNRICIPLCLRFLVERLKAAISNYSSIKGMHYRSPALNFLKSMQNRTDPSGFLTGMDHWDLDYGLLSGSIIPAFNKFVFLLQ